MSENLLKLHIMAAEAQIHKAQYQGGAIEFDTFKERVLPLESHTEIDIPEEHHAERVDHCRQIIDSTITLAKISG